MKTYWITWAVLLAFTMVMIWADGAAIPRTAFVVFVLGAMLTKASIIGANFMHLRHENAGIVVTVVVGLVATGVLLYVLISPDAARIHQMVRTYGPR
jgi:cytochrome c oxidase subunit IV